MVDKGTDVVLRGLARSGKHHDFLSAVKYRQQDLSRPILRVVVIVRHSRIRQINDCHNELPVTYQYQCYFLAPKSRILTRTSTLRNCNELLPIMFKIHDSWYRSIPRLVETISPSNRYSTAHASYMELRQFSISRHEWNIFQQGFESLQETYHVPHRKTLRPKHNS